MNIKLIKFLDKTIGNVICRILGIFNSPKNNIRIAKKFLVIQLWGIGESILTLPSVYTLIKIFPESKVDILVTERNSEIYFGIYKLKKIKLKLNPFSIVNFIFRNFGKYDVVVDMEEYLNISSIISFFVGKERIGYSHNSRAKLYTKKVAYNDRQHAAQTYYDLLKYFNVNDKVKKLERLNYNEGDIKNVDLILRKYEILKNEFIVGIAPGAAESAKSRMWPKERYAELSNRLLQNKQLKIIFVGNDEESILIESIMDKIKNKNKSFNLAGRISLRELFYLVTKCKLFIGNDAGAMHVAAAQGVKTIGLFGPNLPVRFGPFGDGNVAVYKGDNCEFSPCINVHKGQVPDCLFAKNSADYQKCMKNISVEDVMREVGKKLINHIR